MIYMIYLYNLQRGPPTPDPVYAGVGHPFHKALHQKMRIFQDYLMKMHKALYQDHGTKDTIILIHSS